MTDMADGAQALKATALFGAWLESFGAALEAGDTEVLRGMFDETGHWKDLLAFTWEHRTFSGRAQIGDALAATWSRVRPQGVRLAAGRSAPRLRRRSARDVLEGYFDFDTHYGHGTAFVRLTVQGSHAPDMKVWLMLTTLQELRDHKERVGRSRPTFDEYARNTTPTNWLDDRRAQAAFTDRNPEVLIVGAGHAGLILAARLAQLGVDTLVIEKGERVGDNWRERYHTLTLHNESTANHMPYMPFPESWPVWLPKDKLAGWLESYAEAMDTNVWTRTELLSSSFDAGSGHWTARICREGVEQELHCKHLVVAIGVSGSIPNMPAMPGLQSFRGEVMHSSGFTSGTAYRGKRAIVVGTGNSAHDVAQDLYLNGAAEVWIYQRSPTCVVSLKPSAIMVYSVYNEGAPVDDVDLMTTAIPYPVLHDTYRFMTTRHRALDAELIERLHARGFETWYGKDDTGFHMMYLSGDGGYYINVGCSDLIAEGKIGVIQARDSEGFVAEGLRMKDGNTVPCDLVVLATGFRNMQEGVRQLVGDAIADRLGPIWGFDEDWQMRNMWRRTAQDNLWIMGGALIDARLNSRFLAIEIKAALDGVLPARSEMPWVPRDGARITTPSPTVNNPNSKETAP